MASRPVRVWAPAVALLAAGVLLIGAANVARADAGVALDLREVRVEDQLDPGRHYVLPALTVHNPGDEPSTYRMGAGGVEGDEYLDPVTGWFTFAPSEFDLAAGEFQQVEVSLDIPQDATPGDYYGLLRAELMPEGEGPLVGVAAGSEITFVVTERGDLGAFLRWLGSIFTALMPWSYVLPILLLALLIGIWVRKRFRFRIEAR